MSTNNASLSAHASTWWPDGGRQVRQPSSYWADRIDCPKGCGKVLHRNHMPQHLEKCNGPHVAPIPQDHERCGCGGIKSSKAYCCYLCGVQESRMDELDKLLGTGKYKVAGVKLPDEPEAPKPVGKKPRTWREKRSRYLLATGQREKWQAEFGSGE